MREPVFNLLPCSFHVATQKRESATDGATRANDGDTWGGSTLTYPLIH